MPAREIISAKHGRPLMKNHRKVRARAVGQFNSAAAATLQERSDEVCTADEFPGPALPCDAACD
jgi:hypothetical protein